MPQSLTKLATHIIFSTKYRQPLIDNKIEPVLYAYLGGVSKELECIPIKVGGYKDHVHILCLLSKKVALVDLVEEVKKRSSKWIKTKGEPYVNFYWQSGYGAFSVNPAEIDVIIRYIEQQHEHHQKMSFQNEYKAFLKKYKIEFDERYAWD
ncbi:MAG: IS200/IS605 family transposase [Ferruginibacter sp.]